MNLDAIVSRYSQIFCPCAKGWKTYARCAPRTHVSCQKCRLYKWRVV